MTPARIASSMRRLKRRRRMKDRRIIADDTKSNKNNVARNVNLQRNNNHNHNNENVGHHMMRGQTPRVAMCNVQCAMQLNGIVIFGKTK